MWRRTSHLFPLVLLCGVSQTGVSVADGPRFIGRLPQGTVQLMGVTDFPPTKRSRWWQPDGSAATLHPYRPQHTDPRWQNHGSGKRLTLLVRLKNLPSEQPSKGQGEHDQSSAQASRPAKFPPTTQPSPEQGKKDPSADDPWLPAKNLPGEQPSKEQSEHDQSADDAWLPAKNLPGEQPSKGQSEHDPSAADARLPAKNLPTEPTYGQDKHDQSTAKLPDTAWWIYPSPPPPPGSYQPIGGSPYWIISSVMDADENTVPDCKMFSAVVAASARTADLRVGVSMGTWETVMTRKPDSAGTSSFSRDGQQWTVKFYKPEKFRKTDSTQVRLALTWREFYAKWDRRLVAVTGDGKQHPAVINYGDNASAVFYNLPLSSIKELRFQVRPYCWVEFQNVSLRAGQNTDVKVVSSDDLKDAGK
jgi:hypothetical protein